MELFRALGALIEPPTDELKPVADALELGPLPSGQEHTELFSFQLYPYASVYLGPEGMLGGEARDRIAGFYVAMRQTPPAEPDHLTDLFAFYAWIAGYVTDTSRPQLVDAFDQVCKAFLWEHLASWLPPYLLKVREIGAPFYRRWATLTETALAQEAARLGEPEQISSHLLNSPGLIDPREATFSEFLDSVLAPVRSGIVLTRTDLLSVARKLGLGIRLGERKYILNALFEQDAPGMLNWLAEQAGIWVKRHQELGKTFGATSQAWEVKAATAGALLFDLTTSAKAES